MEKYQGGIDSSHTNCYARQPQEESRPIQQTRQMDPSEKIGEVLLSTLMLLLALVLASVMA